MEKLLIYDDEQATMREVNDYLAHGWKVKKVKCSGTNLGTLATSFRYVIVLEKDTGE